MISSREDWENWKLIVDTLKKVISTAFSDSHLPSSTASPVILSLYIDKSESLVSFVVRGCECVGRFMWLWGSSEEGTYQTFRPTDRPVNTLGSQSIIQSIEHLTRYPTNMQPTNLARENQPSVSQTEWVSCVVLDGGCGIGSESHVGGWEKRPVIIPLQSYV